ncbi:hypothetical protein F4804DRAFT_312836 [Jackrogersella minutella]|nr:hypothetical protein F4804DRAFT_312836 [Jackrogersella minutella]
MMNGTDVAAFQPVSLHVRSPPTHGLTPAGVVPIDHTSCKARKRSRMRSFPPPANYTPSSFSSSPSSRITKANNPKRPGARSSLSSSSSSPLARPSPRKKRSIAADVTAVPSIAAPATKDEPKLFRHYIPVDTWNFSVPSGPPNYSGQFIVPETNFGTRDHFTLSSTLTQVQGPDVYDWYLDGSNPFTLSSLPTCHPSVSYLTTHGNMAHESSPGDDLAKCPGVTDPTRSEYSLHSSFDLVPTRNMILEHRPLLNGDTSDQKRSPLEPDPSNLAKSEGGGMDDNQDDGWLLVDLEPSVKQPIEDDSQSICDGLQRISNLSSRDSSSDPEWEHVVHESADEATADENHPWSHPERRFRSQLDIEGRRQAGITRKLKACIRCRMQKIKCEADPDNKDEDCLTCGKINLESKKVIHRLPCLRWKLAEVVLFRAGGLNLTKRWDGVKMKDLGPRDWVNEQVRVIKVTIGCRQIPLELSVRKFKPINGDVIRKYWVDAKGEKRSYEVEPYALADIMQTSKEYQIYVYTYARTAISEYATDIDNNVDEVVQKTYKAVLDYHMRLIYHPNKLDGDDVDHYHFIEEYMCLWFAIRNTIGSAFIVGDDHLDMEPVDDEESPYNGKVFIPRMIPAQFDSLGHEMVLEWMRKSVLEDLWKMMASKNPRHFYLIYLTVFMLLHEVSVSSRDRLRHARENKVTESRYDLAPFVEKLQEGSNITLSHWHYYKRDFHNMMADTESDDKKHAVWGELNPEEAQLLVETREAYEKRAKNEELEEMTWEDDLYFVSQMFEDGWKPKPTFNW